MAFEFKQGEHVPKGVRRIICKRIDQALESLNGSRKAVSDHAVHEARKRFKEIRGTLRLVRTELGDKIFRRENETFRDAGQPLSTLRDAKVMIDSLDGLIEHFEGRIKSESVAWLRRTLLKRRRAIRKQVIERDRAIPPIVRNIGKAKRRAKNWPLQRQGWKAIEGGLQRVYDQGRDAMDAVRAKITNASLHEWRKRAKDLRYELELLQCTWPEIVKPLADQAHELTNLLGDDHDLAVLRNIAQEESSSGTAISTELVAALIDERRATLQREAITLGEKLYVEKAREFVRRLEGYWKTSRQKANREENKLGQKQKTGTAPGFKK